MFLLFIKFSFSYLNSVLGLSHWHYFHSSTGTPLVLRFGCDWILITWTLGMLYIPSFLFLEIRGSCDGHRVCLVCVVAYHLQERGLTGLVCMVCQGCTFCFWIFFGLWHSRFYLVHSFYIHLSIYFMFLQRIIEIVWFLHTFTTFWFHRIFLTPNGSLIKPSIQSAA